MQERRRAILQELEEYGKVKVAQLSEELNCSEVTIRNDIKAMEKRGFCRGRMAVQLRWNKSVNGNIRPRVSIVM